MQKYNKVNSLCLVEEFSFTQDRMPSVLLGQNWLGRWPINA